MLIDYYSRFVEVVKLPSESSSIVIERMKSVFAYHEIPQEVRSDNGPQFSSALFHKFSIDYKFTHVTKSPRYPASYGEAEKAVRMVKGFLKKCDDLYLKLLTYRSTPLNNGYSPAELLMGRQLSTIIINFYHHDLCAHFRMLIRIVISHCDDHAHDCHAVIILYMDN